MGKTSDYYKSHPEARKKRLEYQAEYNKKPEQLKKRMELNKINRDRGQYADKDGKDMSHKKNGRVVEESASKNRGSKTAMPGDVRSRGGKVAKKKK
jgi:hypothetical protein